jgi:hypothetical protein
MDTILTRFGEVQEEYEHLGGYTLEAQAREVLNEACLELSVPWIHAAVLGSQALAWPILPGGRRFRRSRGLQW